MWHKNIFSKNQPEMHDQIENNKKPTAFPLSQPNLCDMPLNWAFRSTLNDSDVMRFNGSATEINRNFSKLPSSQSPIPSTSGINLQPPRIKRKGEVPNLFPTKQLITEEKMIKHLHGLHLSNNFQAHNINIDNGYEDEMETCYTVNLSPQDLKQRLKNASSIELHEDILKSLKESNRNEIYKVLSNRIEKPCQALVLWQPPQSLDRLISASAQSKEEDECERMLE